MRRLITALMLASAGTASHAETALDYPAPGAHAAWNNLVLGATQTDGSIDGVIAASPDPQPSGHCWTS